MLSLTLTIGLPGSGKSFWARQQVQRMRNEGLIATTISRDGIRLELFDHVWTPGAPMLPLDQEGQVTLEQRRRVREALASGQHVIVDDTNLREEYRQPFADIARQHRALLIVKDYRHVPIETCIENDLLRGLNGGHSVGEGVIRMLAERYL